MDNHVIFEKGNFRIVKLSQSFAIEQFHSWPNRYFDCVITVCDMGGETSVSTNPPPAWRFHSVVASLEEAIEYVSKK